jgi:hypothetical protein
LKGWNAIRETAPPSDARPPETTDFLRRDGVCLSGDAVRGRRVGEPPYLELQLRRTVDSERPPDVVAQLFGLHARMTVSWVKDRGEFELDRSHQV